MACGKQKQNPIRLLVALDENYLPQLHVLLTSAAVNNPGERIELYFMHSRVSEKGMNRVDKQCGEYGWRLIPVSVPASFFEDAPITKRYPQEMYYRLLAAHLLPDTLERVLYLDPDILVINSLRPLWEIDMKGKLFAAASHTGVTELANNVNRLRLGTDSDYFNSGVLLIDLEACRKSVVPQEVFAFFSEHGRELVLPDQDVLNALYGKHILQLDDIIWNYDARNYNSYLIHSSGQADVDWVMMHTAILHFCGKAKPWKPGYLYRFGILYKHYMQMTMREIGLFSDSV
ncbi:MAG: glycosyltransferase family 8 protein [Lachnospiraceae bacterium]